MPTFSQVLPPGSIGSYTRPLSRSARDSPINAKNPANRSSRGRFHARAVRTNFHGKRSERVTNTSRRSNVVVVVIGNAGAVRNGDFQTAGDLGIRNAGINVETFGEVIIRIKRILVERARAGTAPSGDGAADRRKTEVVLNLTIVGKSDVGLAIERVFHTGPHDLDLLGRIKIVVFDAAQEITALGRGANAQRVAWVNEPDVFVATEELDELVQGIFAGDHKCGIVGDDAVFGVGRADQIVPTNGVCIDAVEGRLIGLRQTLRPQQGVHDADRLVVMLVNDVPRKVAE